MAANTFTILGRAALYGVGLGIGAEIYVPKKGASFTGALVVTVALRALSYYCGIGAAIGTVIGCCIGTAEADASAQRADNQDRADNKSCAFSREIFGAMLICGILGHLAESLLDRVVFVIGR